MQMPVGPPRRATYEDVLAAPDRFIAELIDGELFLSPRPAPPHALAATEMIGDLSGPFRKGRGGPGGWWFLFEPELHFGEDVLVPDIAGWRRERLPTVPTAPFLELPPDWVCEVASPSTARLDRLKKLPRYGQVGVAFVWLVDPIARGIEIYRREAGGWLLTGIVDGDRPFRGEPFDAVDLDPREWWAPPPA